MGRHFDFETAPPVDYARGTYLADFLTEKAVDFVRRHKDRPFFLYLPHFAVHTPHQAKAELIARFSAREGVGGHRNPTYAAMIASVDESVARVLAELDRLKLAESTIVIFSSDNGGVGGYEELGWSGVTHNRPLRGGKGMLYEGGVRVPFIVRWPGVVQPGSRSDAMTVHVDLLPTLLEVAGAPRPEQPLDGETMLPLLRDPSTRRPRREVFYHFPGYLEGQRAWRTTPVGTIYSGKWKLLEFFETGRLELYDLESDLSEAEDLAAKLPAQVRELHARLDTWRRSLNAAIPTMR
jgi:arylsulfatase A-like enzyme